MLLDNNSFDLVGWEVKTTPNQVPKSIIVGQHNTGVVKLLTDAVATDDIDVVPDGEWVTMAPAKPSTATIT